MNWSRVVIFVQIRNKTEDLQRNSCFSNFFKKGFVLSDQTVLRKKSKTVCFEQFTFHQTNIFANFQAFQRSLNTVGNFTSEF